MHQESLPTIVACASKLAQERLNVSRRISDGSTLDMLLIQYCLSSFYAGSYDAPSTFDELPSFATEGPPSSPRIDAQQSAQPKASTSQLPSLPLPPVMTPSDSGDDADNADDGDYFASRQEEGTQGDTSAKKRSSRIESDDEDEDYDEGGNTYKRKKKESSATAGTSKLPPLAGAPGNQRRKSSSAGAGNAAKRRKRIVEDEEEAEERRKKASSASQVGFWSFQGDTQSRY